MKTFVSRLFMVFIFLSGLCAVSFAKPVGNITDFKADSGHGFTITCGLEKVKVNFLKHDIFRIWLAPTGHFTNPAGDDIVVNYNFSPISIKTSDHGTYYRLESNECILRVYKAPLKFALYQKDNETLVWQEAGGLDYGPVTYQSLKRGVNEHFYGGGMQNGYFSHREKNIRIERYIPHWDDGAVSNPAPFYISTAGYGVFRNTFKKGSYHFADTVQTSHDEERFDAFYFYGPSIKKVLDGYTQLTGRPFLPPRWALGFGDADCYRPTNSVVSTAQSYRDHDMPGSWFLPNDGYSCGYTDLQNNVSRLEKLGFKTGLWTEDGLDKIALEVGTYGSRVCKLDIAWVWPGYQFALNAAKTAYEGIENNSDGRGFVWETCGWAGTHRYSTVWTGDNVGNWEYIRMQIPSVIGSGLSALNCATGDVDGIFGGSPDTYVRDLQWKVFTPVLMVISGWAPYDKQPFRHGEPYTGYNRESLKLKNRLTPYIYTYCNEAYETGVPTTRAMVLEFPDDPKTFDKTTQYQFMSGEWFLVAPVYTDTRIRKDIYLPKGKWTDYRTGKVYTGPGFVSIPAPLDSTPVLVKAGAIIPMYPEFLYDSEKPLNPLTLDLYPSGESSFEMYEDDGITREHRNGAFAKQRFTSDAPVGSVGTLKFSVGKSMGTFKGKLSNRDYRIEIHTSATPTDVTKDNQALKQYFSNAALNAAKSGWYYDLNEKGGMLHVKISSQATSSAFDISVFPFDPDRDPNLSDDVSE